MLRNLRRSRKDYRSAERLQSTTHLPLALPFVPVWKIACEVRDAQDGSVTSLIEAADGQRRNGHGESAPLACHIPSFEVWLENSCTRNYADARRSFRRCHMGAISGWSAQATSPCLDPRRFGCDTGLACDRTCQQP